MLQRLLNEPVVIAGLVNTFILMLIAFGFNVTDIQLTAIMAFVNAVLVFLTRALVVPNQLAEARVRAGLRPTEPINP